MNTRAVRRPELRTVEELAPLTIPQAQQAERAVLGAVLADANCFYRVVDTIGPDDFYNDANRLVFEAFRQLAGDNRDIDLLTTTDQLERSGTLASAGGVGYVASLAEGLPDPANVEHYAAILRDRAVRRVLLHLAQALERDAADAAAPIAATVRAATEELTKLVARLGGQVAPDADADLVALDATGLARATKQAEFAFALLDRPDIRARVTACRRELERRRSR